MTSAMIAGWGGRDFFAKLEEEANRSVQSFPRSPVFPTENERMQILRSLREKPQELLHSLFVLSSASKPCEFELLRTLVQCYRQRGPGQCCCVFSSKHSFAFRYRSYDELQMHSAVFERPDSSILKEEENLLNALVWYKSTGGQLVCAISPLLFAMDVDVIEKLFHSFWSWSDATTTTTRKRRCCCGSVASLTIHVMLCTWWENRRQQTCSEELFERVALQQWWDVDYPLACKRLVMGEKCDISGTALGELLMTVPFGVEDTLHEELEAARQDFVRQQLLTEDKTTAVKDTKKKKKKKRKNKEKSPTAEETTTLNSAATVVAVHSSPLSTDDDDDNDDEKDNGEVLEEVPLLPPPAILSPLTLLQSRDCSSSSDVTEDEDAPWETVLNTRELRRQRKLHIATTTRNNNNVPNITTKKRAQSNSFIEVEVLESPSSAPSTPTTSAVVNNMEVLDSATPTSIPTTPAATTLYNKMEVLESATTPPTTTTTTLHHNIVEMAHALDHIAMQRKPWQLAVAERVKQLVYSIWPRAFVDVFGSIASGLASPCSDVDIVIRGASSADAGVSYSAAASSCKQLASALANEEWVQMLQVIDRTVMPVVKFNTATIPISFGNRGNLIAVDITFENESHHGLNTCGLTRQFALRWSGLKPLVLVLKQFLVERGLNDPYLGGVSSYGLVLMVAFICRRNEHSLHMDLGALFLQFLHLYSSQAFLLSGISLNQTEMPACRPSRFVSDPCYLEDPLDPLNNVGRSCFGISQVQHVFAGALQAIYSFQPMAHTSVLGRVFSTSHHNDVINLVTKVWCPVELPMAPATAAAATVAVVVPSPRLSELEQWALETKKYLFAAHTRAQQQEHESGTCPMCSQPLGRTHEPTACAFYLLATSCPL